MKKELIKESSLNLGLLLLSLIIIAAFTKMEAREIKVAELYIFLNPFHAILLLWLFLCISQYAVRGMNRLSRSSKIVNLWLAFLLFLLLAYSFLMLAAVVKFEKTMQLFDGEQVALQEQFQLRKWGIIIVMISGILAEYVLCRRIYKQFFP